MRCEVVAVGSELLLGQINDTNSSWIGQELAAVGIDSHYQTKVGDNLDRMVEVIELALDRSDAVICTGGLGPTQDDITREAIAAVMGVDLETDEALVEKIRQMFGSRGRDMPESNLLQARVPVGARAIPVQPGTAEGLKIRMTAKGTDEADVEALLDAEDARVREIIGPIVFGVDDENMEAVVLRLCKEQGLTLATAESITGGLIAQRLTAVPGSSAAFRGGVISYATDVKTAVLGAPEGPSVSEEMVEAMALGACATLGADVAVATTGVAGPDAWEGIPPGTVWVATCVDGEVESHMLRFRTDRDRSRQYTTITVLNMLRKRLLARVG